MAEALPLREAQKALTRTRIETAARDLFYTQSFAATTMEQIAAAAGTQRSTLYSHYRDKHAILGAIADHYASDLREVIGSLPGPKPSRPQIDAWMMRVSKCVATQRAPTILFTSMGLMADVPPALDRIGDKLFEALAREVAIFKPIRTTGQGRATAVVRARVVLRELFALCIKQTRADTNPEDLAAAVQVTGDLIEFLVNEA